MNLSQANMFVYPKQAEFNRPVPKNKIYGYAKPSRAIRDRFVSQVSEIVWKYKLAPETINLPAKLAVHEIQVFEVALKTGELAEDVLRTMDKAIPSLLFFELTFEGRVKFAAAYKRPNEANSSITWWKPISRHLGSLQTKHARTSACLGPRWALRTARATNR